MKHIAIPLVLASLAAAPVRAGSEPPVITAAAVAPQSVDITSGPETVTVNLTITDDDSGFRYGFIDIFNADGNLVGYSFFSSTDATSGDALDGDYAVDFQVPEYAAPGDWLITISVSDENSNWRYYSPSDESFPTPGDMELSVANSGTIDTDPPLLESSAVSPTTVDTGAGPATITFTFEISDDLSGFNEGYIYPIDPSNQIAYNLGTSFGEWDRISGDEFSGTYEVEMELPQGSSPGTWTYDLELRDRVGNTDFQEAGDFEVGSSPVGSASFLAHALDATHLPFVSGGTGWVINSDDTWDGIDSAVSLPTPDGGSATLATTVTGPGTLRFAWRTDSEVSDDFLSVSVPSAAISQSISGDVPWQEVTLNLPPGAHEVTWSYTKGPSGAAGQDQAWVDHVRFVSTSADSAPPILQALRIDPAYINNENSSDEVYVTMEITDDFHGFDHGTVELIDPSGNIAESRTFGISERISGDANAGLYEVFFSIDVTSEVGIWRVTVELTEASTAATRLYGPGGEPFPLARSERFFVGGSDPEDSEAPRLHLLEISHDPIDVSTGPQQAVVTLHASDLPSGISDGYVSVHNPQGGQTGIYYLGEVVGDGFNSIYQATITVPEFAEPGTWSLGVEIRDLQNYVSYPHDVPFPSGATDTFEVVNNGSFDLFQPLVTSIGITPSSINTSVSPADVQVTLTLTDDLSGIDHGYVYFYDPADNYRGEFATRIDNSNRISGDALAGTYQFTRTLPAGSMIGQWRLHVFVRDKVGRIRIYGVNLDPFPQPADSYFTVTGAAADWFSELMATYGLSGTDALLSADPDKDGWSNAEEVLAKSNPAVAGATGSFASFERDATHLHLLFTIHPEHSVGTSGNYLTVSDGVLAPLRVTGEVQGALSTTWTITAPVFVSGSTWRVSVPLASGPTGFVRLRLENP